MKVICVKPTTFFTDNGVSELTPGETYDFDDRQATELIKRGFAKPAEQPISRKQLRLKAEESKGLVHWPEGVYDVTLVDISEDEFPLSQMDEEGNPIQNPVYRITFKRSDGQTIDGITSRTFSTRSKLYKWISTILGARPPVGEEIDLIGSLVGKRCKIIVKDREAKQGLLVSQVTDVLTFE